MKSRTRITDLCVLLSTVLSVSLTGCNPYSIVDKPSGDAQILDAARACFDHGDYTCASTYYGQLSSASSDQSNSELAFLQMAQVGVSVGVFMKAVVNNSSAAGKIITQIANAIGTNANETTRLALFRAHQNYKNVTDSRVQGLIRFVTAMSLMAELIAEDASTPGDVKKTDLVKDPTACAKTSGLDTTGCEKPTGKKMISGASEIVLASAKESDFTGSPSLYMVNAAVEEIDQALKLLQTSGSLGSASGTFASGILSQAEQGISASTDSPFYRKILIQYEVGAN